MILGNLSGKPTRKDHSHREKIKNKIKVLNCERVKLLKIYIKILKQQCPKPGEKWDIPQNVLTDGLDVGSDLIKKNSYTLTYFISLQMPLTALSPVS